MIITFCNDCPEITTKKLYFLEWSAKQKCFHIGEVQHLLGVNLHSFIENDSLDYIPLAIGTDELELNHLAAALRKRKQGGKK